MTVLFPTQCFLQMNERWRHHFREEKSLLLQVFAMQALCFSRDPSYSRYWQCFGQKGKTVAVDNLILGMEEAGEREGEEEGREGEVSALSISRNVTRLKPQHCFVTF